MVGLQHVLCKLVVVATARGKGAEEHVEAGGGLRRDKLGQVLLADLRSSSSSSREGAARRDVLGNRDLEGGGLRRV